MNNIYASDETNQEFDIDAFCDNNEVDCSIWYDNLDIDSTLDDEDK